MKKELVGDVGDKHNLNLPLVLPATTTLIFVHSPAFRVVVKVYVAEVESVTCLMVFKINVPSPLERGSNQLFD